MRTWTERSMPEAWSAREEAAGDFLNELMTSLLRSTSCNGFIRLREVKIVNIEGLETCCFCLAGSSKDNN